MILRVTALCVAAAMICSALRVQRPEIATALSLAAGLVVLGALLAGAEQIRAWMGALDALSPGDSDVANVVLKGAGIAVVSELGSQLCEDAGERALAGRIALAARVATLGLCAPLFAELAGTVATALS